ncbi:hypothetical protein Sango_2794400 [Sesamum angolense]|uniref:Aminotransferase-like plant mobile domain-containing protein n=1 Tax=Sesamum angolense TaxID=2727404 RepID=A0AAE1T7U9_9LAMI|nr:hypothetical protein Sango_2794400 [Sesamum angolense]
MLTVYAPLIGGRNVNPWPRLTNSSHLSEWCQETSLSKNVKAWILRANHHEPPRHQPSDDFAHLCTLGRTIIEGDAKWDGDLRFTGEFRYTKGYWEWTEDVLSRCGDRLRHLKIYDVVYASLFSYDHNFDIVKKKTVRPKSTHNLLGDIAIHDRWSTVEEALFAKLCIERSLKEEVYLAAYLACWLCVFVLPVWQESRGPKMTKFFGEGGAKYYEPQEARKRIHTAEFVSWACNMLVKNGLFKFVDDGRAEELDHSYFVAIRSSYLTLHQGGRFIIEPYSPHRFGRQFGPKSIKITLKRKKDEDKQVDGGENDPPLALIPPVVIECDSQAAVARQLEDEVQSIDIGKESETSHSSTMTPPLGMGHRRKQSPPPATMPVFNGERFLFNYQKEFLQRLWSGLLVKISNTPVDFLSSIEDDVYLILESMKSFQKFDVSKVEESLNAFFTKVRAYEEARSLSSEKLS